MIVDACNPQDVMGSLVSVGRLISVINSAADLDGPVFVRLGMALVACKKPLKDFTVGEFAVLVGRVRQDYDEDQVDSGEAVERPAWLPHPSELAGN